MFDLIKEFPAQLLKAIEIGEQAKLNGNASSEIKSVLVCGLGGSGIGGNLLAELLRNEIKVPVIVNKGYFIPAFTDSSTLVILSSYSGDTEETISVATQVLNKGLKPVCVTSGGKLEALAVEHKLDLIKIPGGFPPRACLGYSSVQLFFILHHYGLIGNGFIEGFKKSAALLTAEQQDLIKRGEALAGKLKNKDLIAYAEDKYESVALRFKQQANENGKTHCWHNVFPELNHNELVGWRNPHPELGILMFRSDEEYSRITQRMNFSKDVFSKQSDVHEIVAKGTSAFERRFYLIHFGDWISYYLAIQQGYDATEIEVLLKLKAHMKSVKD
jgi:glucose/mannose-6-phosphate isomerase